MPFLVANIGRYLPKTPGWAITYSMLNKVLYIVLVAAFTKIAWDLVLKIKDMILKSKVLFSYHGAEHKAAKIYETGKELILQNVRGACRISEKCGTNLAVFWVAILCISLLFPHGYSAINLVISYALAYEVFRINGGEKKFGISLFYKLSFYLQDKILTREPTDQQIELAILALKNLEKLENE